MGETHTKCLWNSNRNKKYYWCPTKLDPLDYYETFEQCNMDMCVGKLWKVILFLVITVVNDKLKCNCGYVPCSKEPGGGY